MARSQLVHVAAVSWLAELVTGYPGQANARNVARIVKADVPSKKARRNEWITWRPRTLGAAILCLVSPYFRSFLPLFISFTNA